MECIIVCEIGDVHHAARMYMCNELGGEAGAGCIPTRPASAYQIAGPWLQHKPVTTGDCTIYLQLYSDLGSDYSSVIPYGF